MAKPKPDIVLKWTIKHLRKGRLREEHYRLIKEGDHLTLQSYFSHYKRWENDYVDERRQFKSFREFIESKQFQYCFYLFNYKHENYG